MLQGCWLWGGYVVEVNALWFGSLLSEVVIMDIITCVLWRKV